MSFTQQDLEDLQAQIRELNQKKRELVKAKGFPVYRVNSMWDPQTSSHTLYMQEIWVVPNPASKHPGEDDWLDLVNYNSGQEWGPNYASVNPKLAIEKYAKDIEANISSSKNTLKDITEVSIETLLERAPKNEDF